MPFNQSASEMGAEKLSRLLQILQLSEKISQVSLLLTKSSFVFSYEQQKNQHGTTGQKES